MPGLGIHPLEMRIGARYAPVRDILLRLSTNVVGPYTPFDEPGVVLDPYALLHASPAVTYGDVRVLVGIRNLLDRTYPALRAGGFVSPGQPWRPAALRDALKRRRPFSVSRQFRRSWTRTVRPGCGRPHWS